MQDKQANAFCMPGGKIVVYEGLLPYTQNEASLAIVLGHEIAHAVAKHSAEQITKTTESKYWNYYIGNSFKTLQLAVVQAILLIPIASTGLSLLKFEV